MSRLLGMTDEERLAFEQATGLKTERLFEVVQSQIMPNVEQTVQTAIREVQEVIGPHGAVTRMQAGGVRVARTGVAVFADGVQKTMIEADGDFFVGSDITDPSTTSFAVFVVDQVYNNESMGAGDLLIGDNSSSRANILYDASVGRLNFRGGTTTRAYIDTDGKIVGGSGTVRISDSGIAILESAVDSTAFFSFYDSAGTTEQFGIYSFNDNLVTVSRLVGQGIEQIIKLTDASTPYLKWYETPGEANTAQLEINAGVTSTRVLVGNDIILRANKDGTETVFNERSNNINFRVETGTNTHGFFINAVSEYASFFGTSANGLLIIDNGTDKRIEIGQDHYLPTRSGSNTTIFFNEANQDMDFNYRGSTDDDLWYGDAGNNRIGVGTSTPAVKFHVAYSSAATNAIQTVANFDAVTTGTAAIGFGAEIVLRAENASGTVVEQGELSFSWTDASNGAETAYAVINIMDNGGLTEGLRITTVDIEAQGVAIISSLTTGWIQSTATWTRTANHTFTMSGDTTATMRKGTKVRYKDGGSNEYGVVASSSHSGGTTTITLITNSDYAMAAATITETYISYIENPEGFPDWFNWTPTFGSSQFSADPTNMVHKWTVKGRMIHLMWRMATNGVSNGTGFTITNLPVAAITISNAAWAGSHTYVDNGTAAANLGSAQVTSGSSTLSFFTATATGVWTNANGKRSANGFINYEF